VAHVSLALSDTTSYGENDNSKEVTNVVMSDVDLSWILDALMMAWHRSDLQTIRNKILETNYTLAKSSLGMALPDPS
jgi:hypothetical protein